MSKGFSVIGKPQGRCSESGRAHRAWLQVHHVAAGESGQVNSIKPNESIVALSNVLAFEVYTECIS